MHGTSPDTMYPTSGFPRSAFLKTSLPFQTSKSATSRITMILARTVGFDQSS